MSRDLVLEKIAADLCARHVAWEERTGSVPSVRTFERIVLHDDYEAWLIVWPPGTELDLHDHGASAGAFAVVAGRLDETVLTDGRRVSRQWSRGEVASFGPSYVHGVSNRTDGPATSVHVYSPPLSTMEFYDFVEGGELVAAIQPWLASTTQNLLPSVSANTTKSGLAG